MAACPTAGSAAWITSQSVASLGPQRRSAGCFPNAVSNGGPRAGNFIAAVAVFSLINLLGFGRVHSVANTGRRRIPGREVPGGTHWRELHSRIPLCGTRFAIRRHGRGAVRGASSVSRGARTVRCRPGGRIQARPPGHPLRTSGDPLSGAPCRVARLGKLQQALPPGGGMLAVGASEERVTTALATGHPGACIAAVNGPASVVVAGERAEIDRLRTRFEAEGVRTSVLNVTVAFHSPQKALFGQLDEASGSDCPRHGQTAVVRRISRWPPATKYRASPCAPPPGGHTDINESPGLPTTATATAYRYRVPVAVIPSGKISFQAVMKRFISSSVPIDTRK